MNIRKIVTGITLTLLFSVSASIAQVSVSCLLNPRIEIGAGAYCTPVRPETICVGYGDSSGLGGCACGRPLASCPPPNARYEICVECLLRALLSQQAGGSPISFATGNTYIDQVDVSQLPGRGFGIGISRTWNSLWPASQSSFQTGIFGNNWRSTYEERVFTGGDGYIKYARANGSFWSFGFDPSGVYKIAAPSTVAATLTTDNATYWMVAFQNGEKRVFDMTSGNLKSITDRNGNATLVAYDGYGRLSQITDPLSRTLTFIYGTNSSAYLVTSIKTSAGHVATYTYNQNRLTSVTEPDGTVLTFEYGDTNQNLITAVKDSKGVVLEGHTYDSTGRGLSSVRANGAEAISVSYQNQ